MRYLDFEYTEKDRELFELNTHGTQPTACFPLRGLSGTISGGAPPIDLPLKARLASHRKSFSASSAPASFSSVAAERRRFTCMMYCVAESETKKMNAAIVAFVVNGLSDKDFEYVFHIILPIALELLPPPDVCGRIFTAAAVTSVLAVVGDGVAGGLGRPFVDFVAVEYAHRMRFNTRPVAIDVNDDVGVVTLIIMVVQCDACNDINELSFVFRWFNTASVCLCESYDSHNSAGGRRPQ